MKKYYLWILALFVFVLSAQYPPQYFFPTNSAQAAEILGIDVGVETTVLTAATGSNFTAGKVGYINSSGQIVLASALDSNTSNGLLLMALGTTNAGESGAFRFLDGNYTTSALTPGLTYYLSATAGEITSTAPIESGAIRRPLGYALSATKLILRTTPGAFTANATTDPIVQVGPPVVESTSTGFESDGTITTVAPIDITSGNTLILFSADDHSTGSNSSYTPPAGFSELVAYQRANPGAAGTGFQAWSKAAAGENDNYDLGESGLVNTATVMLNLSGVDSQNPIDISSCSTGTTEPVTAPSITATVDDAMIIRTFAWDASKTVVLAPAGYTEAVHVDQSAVDLWVGYKLQAVSGATGTAVMDISSNTPWIACTFAIKEPNASSTSTGGGGAGGGSTDVEGSGPFSMLDDGTGHPIKLTLPIACDGSFTGSACEIFPNNDFHWEVGEPDLITYEHPIYFIRDPAFYTFCSPNTGATTSSAQNGRSELRYLVNVTSGTMSRQYVFRVPSSGGMADGAIANIGQIHRNPGSPVYKGTYTHKLDGTGIYRILSKPFDGGNDASFNIGLGEKTILNSIAPGDYIRVKYEWNIAAETLSFWINNDEGSYVETELTGDPIATLTGVQLDSPGGAYSKLGMYMNNAGAGLNTDPMCVRIYQDIYTGP